MTTLTTSQVFSQLAILVGEDVFTNAVPVINATLANIAANPAQWTNPLSAALLANSFLAQLTATLPVMEQSAVTGAARLVGAVLTAVNAKLTAAAATVTPVSVGTEVGQAVTGA